MLKKQADISYRLFLPEIFQLLTNNPYHTPFYFGTLIIDIISKTDSNIYRPKFGSAAPDFYDRVNVWWNPDPQGEGFHQQRACLALPAHKVA